MENCRPLWFIAFLIGKLGAVTISILQELGSVVWMARWTP